MSENSFNCICSDGWSKNEYGICTNKIKNNNTNMEKRNKYLLCKLEAKKRKEKKRRNIFLLNFFFYFSKYLFK